MFLFSGCCDLTDEDKFFLNSSEAQIMSRILEFTSIFQDKDEVKNLISANFPNAKEWESYYLQEPAAITLSDGVQGTFTKELRVQLWENPSVLCTRSQLKAVKVRLFVDSDNSVVKIVVSREIDSL